MRGLHVVVGLFVASCSSSALTSSKGGDRGDASAGCTKDADCKADPICSKGECVSPADGGASGGATASGGSSGSAQSAGTTGTDDAGASTGGRRGQGGRGSGGGRASGGALGAGGAPGAGGVVIFGTGGGGTGGKKNTCVEQTFPADPLPVDMYLMFDQSASMADTFSVLNPPTTWWKAAQAAVTNFVNDPRAAAISVGIQYFSLDGISPQSCVANYKTPEVELGLLPGNAAAVATSIANHNPSAFTPTAPALSGALAHMKEWAPKHAGRLPVVVLVTDGFPTECDPLDIPGIAQIAATAFMTEPSVRTFVVGFNLGPGTMKELAVAGGTNSPFLIGAGDDISSRFIDAMLGIAYTQLPCKFDLPDPPQGQPALDVSRLSVAFTRRSTMVEAQIPKLNGLGDCELNKNAGWFYDSPTSPMKIELCPGTCGALSSGVVKLQVDCEPLMGITR